MEKIFVVTTLHSKKTRRRRTWGWFEDFEEAQECVAQNEGDIFECGFYDLAVIEEISPGITLKANRQFWVSAEYDVEYGYAINPISKPLKFAKEHLIAF